MLTLEKFLASSVVDNDPVLSTRPDLSLTNIALYVLALVRFVEQFKKMTGREKKQTVLKFVREMIEKIADETNPNEDKDRIVLEQVLKTLIPSLIDSLVSIENESLVPSACVVRVCRGRKCRCCSNGCIVC